MWWPVAFDWRFVHFSQVFKNLRGSRSVFGAEFQLNMEDRILWLQMDLIPFTYLALFGF
jgi:hypothetical protein